MTATSKVGQQTGQEGPNPLRGFWDTLLCPFGGFLDARSTCPTSSLASTRKVADVFGLEVGSTGGAHGAADESADTRPNA